MNGQRWMQPRAPHTTNKCSIATKTLSLLLAPIPVAPTCAICQMTVYDFVLRYMYRRFKRAGFCVAWRFSFENKFICQNALNDFERYTMDLPLPLLALATMPHLLALSRVNLSLSLQKNQICWNYFVCSHFHTSFAISVIRMESCV